MAVDGASADSLRTEPRRWHDAAMTTPMAPTKPRASAAYLAWGLGLVLIGGPLIIAASVQAITWTSGSYYGGTSPAVGLGWAGALVSLLGIGLLITGVYRLAQHADRAAGVLHPVGHGTGGDAPEPPRGLADRMG